MAASFASKATTSRDCFPLLAVTSRLLPLMHHMGNNIPAAAQDDNRTAHRQNRNQNDRHNILLWS